ncbi:hypothetical protein CPB83DRAFT_900599 [Crepidotus variabilis]|uniref:Uncharacterized protein n=1 Tax=Crepidotus variabilis TaxID=179855 RepID=A0A9P6E2Y6_9AGAR|nr:hypothetical protein CPB83DRAFT_900599 [Crepidotus variabilis]
MSQITQSTGEVVQVFSSYKQAAKNACAVLGNIKPSRVELYIGRMGDGRDKVVGVELIDKKNKKIARIRLDIDVPKGIHWNTEDWQSKETKKTASCLIDTKGKPTQENVELYASYLRAIDNIQADTIWEFWKTGSKPI